MAALKEQVLQWSKAIEFFDKEDFVKAFEEFVAFADFGKIHFNVGMCAMRINDLEEAIAAFGRAIACDEYLAVAYMQRGTCLYHQGYIEDALDDFQEAFKKLRNNFYIDYTQLGLDFQVFACHVIFNIALCHIQLGDMDRGMRYLNEALNALPDDGKFNPDVADIKEAIKYQDRAPDYTVPYEVPPNAIFRPQDDNVKNAKKVDYLGKSKVVAGADATDNYTGFSGKRMRDLTLGRAPARAPREDKPSRDVVAKAPAAVTASKSAATTSNHVTLNRKGTSTAGSAVGSTQQPGQQSNDFPRERSPSSAAPGGNSGGTLARAATVGPNGARPRVPSRSSSVSGPGTLSALPPRNDGSYSRRPSLTDVPERGPRQRSHTTGHSAGYSDDAGRDYNGEGISSLLSPGSHSPSPMSSVSNRNLERDDPFNHVSVNQPPPPASAAGTSASTGTSGVPPGSIRVKCHYTESRVILVPASVSYADLRDRISAKFGMSDSPLSFKYKDDSGRLTLMVNDDDLNDAIDLSPAGRLELWCFLLD
ncbi:hypothetical protein BC831DRAFT_461327 [Entophlyctis helioformis]|nr:hypothetical protein BC831DRAFT_461327 [Entophlyctis helioformis]